MKIEILILVFTILTNCLAVKNLTKPVRIFRRDRLKVPTSTVKSLLKTKLEDIKKKSDHEYHDYEYEHDEYSHLSDEDYWEMIDNKSKEEKIVVDSNPVHFEDPYVTTDSIFNKCQQSFQKACLRAHNRYRSNHHSPDLVWNEELQRRAQNYAEYLASSNNFEHSGAQGYGENLAYSWSSSVSSLGNDCRSYGLKYSKSWYNEVNEYSYNNPGFSKGTGHFTQLVWKETTDIGCGIAMSHDDKVYAVCNYTPPGNFNSHYEENVLPI